MLNLLRVMARFVLIGYLIILSYESLDAQSTALSRSPSVQAQIVGGDDAEFGEYPWQVQVYIPGSVCGGSLIAPNWVLTAAYCVTVDEATAQLAEPDQISIVLGDYNRSHFEGTEQERTAKSFVVHPDYNVETNFAGLALINLDAPAVSTEFVQAVPLIASFEENLIRAEQFATVTGWGNLTEEGPQATVLQEVTLPMVSRVVCNNDARHTFNRDTLCAGYSEGGKDACFGDGGGGLLVQSQNGWIQAGVTQTGIGCARPNTYGYYTNLLEHMDWIIDVTGIQNRVPTPDSLFPETSIVNLLANGDFDAGADGSWIENSVIFEGSTNILILELLQFQDKIAPNSGDYAVWLGGGDSESASLSQSVVVPSYLPVSLSYYYQIRAQDECGRDFVKISVNGITVKSIDLCGLTETEQWQQDEIDLSGYAGQLITVSFNISTDSFSPYIGDAAAASNFFLDDVTMTVSDVQPTEDTPLEPNLQPIPRKLTEASFELGLAGIRTLNNIKGSVEIIQIQTNYFKTDRVAKSGEAVFNFVGTVANLLPSRVEAKNALNIRNQIFPGISKSAVDSITNGVCQVTAGATEHLGNKFESRGQILQGLEVTMEIGLALYAAAYNNQCLSDVITELGKEGSNLGVSFFGEMYRDLIDGDVFAFDSMTENFQHQIALLMTVLDLNQIDVLTEEQIAVYELDLRKREGAMKYQHQKLSAIENTMSAIRGAEEMEPAGGNGLQIALRTGLKIIPSKSGVVGGVAKFSNIVLGAFDTYMSTKAATDAHSAIQKFGAPALLDLAPKAMMNVAENTINGIELISSEQVPLTPDGQIINTEHFVEYRRIGRLKLSNKRAYSEIGIKNVGFVAGEFFVAVKYTANTTRLKQPWAFIDMILESDLISLQPGEEKVVELEYKDENEGYTPLSERWFGRIEETDLDISLFATTDTGMYKVAGYSEAWQPKDVSKSVVASSAHSGNYEVIHEPVISFLQRETIDSSTFLGAIWVTNPFSTTVQYNLSQLLPSNAEDIESTLGVYDNKGTLHWEREIQGYGTDLLTYQFSLDASLLQEVDILQIDAAQVTFWQDEQVVIDTQGYSREMEIKAIGSSPMIALTDSSFENPSSGAWMEDSSTYGGEGSLITHVDALPETVAPYDGEAVAWLGGANNETSLLIQEFMLPANAESLAFYYQTRSSDVCGHDSASVLVNQIKLVDFQVCAEEETDTWTLQTTDVRQFAGKPVILTFRLLTDNALKSNWFIDQVVVTTSSQITLTAEPSQLTFMKASSAKVENQNIAIQVDAAASWSVTTDSGDWLTVETLTGATTGIGPAALIVSVDPTNKNTGIYEGVVLLRSQSVLVTVPVVLDVLVDIDGGSSPTIETTSNNLYLPLVIE